jgi:hypothetical protein
MITMPMSTPSAIRPAVRRKSEPPPVAAGAADVVVATDGLATATAERDGTGVVLTVVVGAVVGAAVVGAAVRDGVALAVDGGDGDAAAVGVALTVAGGGDGDAPVVPSDAHARESLIPGAVAHTDRAGVTQELPSPAVRESDTRMKG